MRSIGKSGFRFWKSKSGFPDRTRNPKTVSPPRNPFSGWISIKKSKSGFHGFPFYHSIGKSVQGFAKLFSWTAVFFLLIMRAHARPLLLRTVFQILLRVSQSNGKNENPKTDLSALKSAFGFRVRLQRMLLKRGAGSGERGAGNGERKSENELSAETSIKIQNGR